jgi:hypothetical protein
MRSPILATRMELSGQGHLPLNGVPLAPGAHRILVHA